MVKTKKSLSQNFIIDNNFLLASKNVPKIDILPVAGINVYDILKRDHLVLSENAVNSIKERFKV